MLRRLPLKIFAILLICFLVTPFNCNKDNQPAGYDGHDEPDSLSVTDIDGNIYPIVRIGDQWCMAENLKVTRYRNGNPIPNVTSITEWIDLTTPALCAYNNDSTYVAVYGSLYNWYAVQDSRNIAPAGWHIPSVDEWQALIDYLGGASVAGGKMKETGTTLWLAPNAGATNESGFSARPAGCRDWTGHWTNVRLYAYFWSATETDSDRAKYLSVDYYYPAAVIDSYQKRAGFSIRCVKD